MSNDSSVKIKSVNIDLVNALTGTLDGLDKANANLRDAKAAEIQKRGFTYNGDTHQGWGLGGNGLGLHGSTGFTGTSPYFGRGYGLDLNGFNLQPFGIGSLGVMAGAGISSSAFANSGAGARYSRATHIAKVKMALAVEAYKGFGIVKNVIDLMCNFASEGLTVVHPSPVIQRFYKRWFEAVDMEGRATHGLRSYYKHGNVFIYTTMGKIDDMTYRQMRSTRGNVVKPQTMDPDILDTNDPSSQDIKTRVNREKKKPVSEREIPWRYTFLNPFQMDIRGSKFFGQSEWVFILDELTRAEIQNVKSSKNVDVLDETDINLPLEFKNLLEDDTVVKLDQSKLWTLHYMKDDHEDWADPMVWPVMNDIMYKNSLRSMDMSVVNSTINAITIFKLGDIKNGFVAPKEHYEKLSQMLRTPTYSHNIVWYDAISMESNYPPIEKILSIDKYRSVDRDILAGLGIPGILVNGAEGGSFSNAFLQVRTLLERLEDGRREISKWINKQLRIVAEVMGHKQIPIVRFGQMSLRDEQAEKKLIIQLLDRNIISAETVLDSFGKDFLVEVERLKNEKAISEKDDIMMKFGPFKDPMNMMDTEDMMDKEHKMELETVKLQRQNREKTAGPPSRHQGAPKNAPGRPGGDGTPHETKRETKPQGMGLGRYETLRSRAADAHEIVENHLTNLMLKARDASYKKALSKIDRYDLEELIHNVYSNVDLNRKIDENYVNELLTEPSIHPGVEKFYAKTHKEMGDDLSISERRTLRIISLARYFFIGEDDAV